MEIIRSRPANPGQPNASPDTSGSTSWPHHQRRHDYASMPCISRRVHTPTGTGTAAVKPCTSPRVSLGFAPATARLSNSNRGRRIWTPPGEWHWQGATSDRFMTHLAMWEAGDGTVPDTEWAEPVTDQQYNA